MPHIDPNSLPDTWQMTRDAHGQPLYINKTTGEKSWRPPSSRKAPDVPVGHQALPLPAVSPSDRRDYAVADAQQREAERDALRQQWRARDAQALAEYEAQANATRETILAQGRPSRATSGRRSNPASPERRSTNRAATASSPRSPRSPRSSKGRASAAASKSKSPPRATRHVPSLAPAPAITGRRAQLERAAVVADAIDESLRAAATGQGDLEAQAKGMARGAAYLEWLHSDVDVRPPRPLDDFKFEFDEAAAAKALRQQASDEAAAAAELEAEAHAQRAEARLAARARRLNHNIAHPPVNLSVFQKRLWVAFCEHESDEAGGGLTKSNFDAAMSAVGLDPPSSEALAARWRRVDLDATTNRVAWVEFKRVGTRLKSLDEATKSEAASSASAKAVAADRHAATKIQSSYRGRSARKTVVSRHADRRKQAQQMLAEEEAREQAQMLLADANARARYAEQEASARYAAQLAETYSGKPLGGASSSVGGAPYMGGAPPGSSSVYDRGLYDREMVGVGGYGGRGSTPPGSQGSTALAATRDGPLSPLLGAPVGAPVYPPPPSRQSSACEPGLSRQSSAGEKSPHKPGRRPKSPAFAPSDPPGGRNPPYPPPSQTALAATRDGPLSPLLGAPVYPPPQRALAPSTSADSLRPSSAWPVLDDEPLPFERGAYGGSSAGSTPHPSGVDPRPPATFSRHGSHLTVPDHMLHLQSQPLRLPSRGCGPNYATPTPLPSAVSNAMLASEPLQRLSPSQRDGTLMIREVHITPADQAMATKLQAAQRAKLARKETTRRRTERDSPRATVAERVAAKHMGVSSRNGSRPTSARIPTRGASRDTSRDVSRPPTSNYSYDCWVRPPTAPSRPLTGGGSRPSTAGGISRPPTGQSMASSIGGRSSRASGGSLRAATSEPRLAAAQPASKPSGRGGGGAKATKSSGYAKAGNKRQVGGVEAKLLARAASLLEADASRKAALSSYLEQAGDEAAEVGGLLSGGASNSLSAAALVASVPGVTSAARAKALVAATSKRPAWRVEATAASNGSMDVPNTAGGDGPLAAIDAIDSAMLATAFAAMCAPGEQTITLDALPATLRRAGVPGVDALPVRDALASELTGHVALHFAEVLQIADKLKLRTTHGSTSGGGACYYPHPGTADSSGSYNASGGYAPPPSAAEHAPPTASVNERSIPLPAELHLHLSRAFALECDRGGEHGMSHMGIPASSLRQTLGAAGIALPQGAIFAILGGQATHDDRGERMISWPEFIDIASRVAPHDPSAAQYYASSADATCAAASVASDAQHPHSHHQPDHINWASQLPATPAHAPAPPPGASANGLGMGDDLPAEDEYHGEVIVAITELLLGQTPTQELSARLTATSANAAHEPALPTRKSDVFKIGGVRSAVDLAIVCTAQRALSLAVEVEPAHLAEALVGEVSARRLQQAARVAIHHAAPAIVAVTLSDMSSGAIRGELRVAISPPSVAPSSLRDPAAAATTKAAREPDDSAKAWASAACTGAQAHADSHGASMPSRALDGASRAAAHLEGMPRADYSMRTDLPFTDNDLLTLDKASAAAPARYERQVALANATATRGGTGGSSRGSSRPTSAERRQGPGYLSGSTRAEQFGHDVPLRTALATSREAKGKGGSGPSSPLSSRMPKSPEERMRDEVQHEARLQLAFEALDVTGQHHVGKRELYDALKRVGVSGSSHQMLAIFREAHFDPTSQLPLKWAEFKKLGFLLPQLALLGQGSPAEQLASDQITMVRTAPRRHATRADA